MYRHDATIATEPPRMVREEPLGPPINFNEVLLEHGIRRPANGMPE